MPYFHFFGLVTFRSLYLSYDDPTFWVDNHYIEMMNCYSLYLMYYFFLCRLCYLRSFGLTRTKPVTRRKSSGRNVEMGKVPIGRRHLVQTITASYVPFQETSFPRRIHWLERSCGERAPILPSFVRLKIWSIPSHRYGSCK